MPELVHLDQKQLGVVFLLASVRRCLRDAKKETAFWTPEKVASDYASRQALPGNVKEGPGGVQDQNG